jgi:hypothetical protein
MGEGWRTLVPRLGALAAEAGSPAIYLTPGRFGWDGGTGTSA